MGVHREIITTAELDSSIRRWLTRLASTWPNMVLTFESQEFSFDEKSLEHFLSLPVPLQHSAWDILLAENATIYQNWDELGYHIDPTTGSSTVCLEKLASQSIDVTVKRTKICPMERDLVKSRVLLPSASWLHLIQAEDPSNHAGCERVFELLLDCLRTE